MGTVDEKLTYLLETKEQIKNSLVNKGVEVNDTDSFRSYASKIDSIKVGDGVFYELRGGTTFADCITEIDEIDCQGITSMANMFKGMSYLNKIKSIKNTSTVTHTGSAFYNCDKLTTIPLFDTSAVTDMNNMFNGCDGFNSVPLFNTSNVKNMARMFYMCSLLTEVPQFDTSNATNMSYMFYYCSKLTTVPELDASQVININQMFTSCTNLTNFGGLKDVGKAFTEKSTGYTNYSVTVTSCTNLTHDSLMNIINNLYDLNLTYKVADGGTLYTQNLYLGSENLAKLTEDEIAIATNKGWTVS